MIFGQKSTGKTHDESFSGLTQHNKEPNFREWDGEKQKIKTSDSTEEDTMEKDEKEEYTNNKIETRAAITFTHAVRGIMLVTKLKGEKSGPQIQF